MMTATSEPDSAPLHVVVGGGQIGPMVAARLLARGYRVRIVRRSASTAGAPDGAETVQADVSDPIAAAAAFAGADVVTHCANPRYHRWSKELAPLMRGIVDGAIAAGARRLVVLGNLYVYQVPPGGRLTEDTPVAPVSRKGALRAAADEIALAAGRRGDIEVAFARAADFVGPGITEALFGERMWRKLARGEAVEVMGDVDMPHSYSYAPDVADGLVTLALAARPVGGVWHLPTAPAEPTRAWVEGFAAASGEAPRWTTVPAWLCRVLGLFVPEAKELPEMMYQWRTPYRLDSTRFCAAFGATPTPVARAIAETAAWATATYGAPS